MASETAIRVRERRAASHRSSFPEGEIEPAEVFGMALVLEVVEDGDLRAGAEDGRGESRD